MFLPAADNTVETEGFGELVQEEVSQRRGIVSWRFHPAATSLEPGPFSVSLDAFCSTAGAPGRVVRFTRQGFGSREDEDACGRG